MSYDDIHARILKYHKLGDEKCPKCGLGYPELCQKCGGLVHCEPGDFEERSYSARCENCGSEFMEPFCQKDESVGFWLWCWYWISYGIGLVTKKLK